MAGAVKKAKKGQVAKFIEYLREHENETLIAALAVIAVGLISFKIFDYMTSSFTVRDAATEFADLLREARAVSSERHISVTVTATSATTWRNCVAKLSQGQIELTSLELPAGVSTDGSVSFSPYGIPDAANSFVLRKGGCTLRVLVSEKGLITIPSQ